MEKYIIPPQAKKTTTPNFILAPNEARPVWRDQQMNCNQCKYNDQDVDTFPCAKCHTRN